MGGAGQPEGGRAVIRRGSVIYGADKQVGNWVASKIPGYRLGDGAKALGVIVGQQLAAGVVYENFNGIHIEAAIAAEPGTSWATRDTVRQIFDYPFTQLGCQAISVSVPSSNLASLNLATKLGFEPEAIIKFAAHDQSHLLVLKALKETCKWIGDHGQKGRQRTDASGPAGNGGGGSTI